MHIALLRFKNISVIYSQWDRGQISVKLGTKHVIYQKLANLT